MAESELHVSGIGISKDVVSTIVGIAARRVEGVASVGGNDIASSLINVFTSRSVAPEKAVESSVEDDALHVTVHLAVFYGYPFTKLAADVRAQADRWFPVLDALPQAVTNETLRADLLARAQSAQAALDAAAEAYAAVEGDAAPLVAGEPFLYDLWKTIADPPMLNAEAIAVHTNAFQGLPRYQPARDDLPEVLALTQQFRLLFPQWAEEQLKQAAASTNETAFTAADRDLIARTADAIVPLLSPPVSDDAKRRVMEALLLIRDHLPKPPAQPPPKRQPPPEQPPQQQQQPSEGQPPPDKQPPPQPSEQEREDQARQEDLQALLQKAADREREHEAEKRAASPRLPPSLRDW